MVSLSKGHTILNVSYRRKAQWFYYQDVILSRQSIPGVWHNGFVIKKVILSLMSATETGHFFFLFLLLFVIRP